jgi:ribonuclease HI
MKELRFEIFVDGSGTNHEGVARCAFIAPGSALHVEWGTEWTCNEAEYRALIAALRWLPPKSSAIIYSDSELVVNQVNGEYETKKPHLRALLSRISAIIAARKLSIEVVCIPGSRNKAGVLLRRKLLLWSPIDQKMPWR